MRACKHTVTKVFLDCGGWGGALNRTHHNKALMQSNQHLADLSPAITAYQAKKEPGEHAGLSLGRGNCGKGSFRWLLVFSFLHRGP